MTLPEGMLWQALRRRPGELKFRRQHPVGRYIVDFYCPAAKLIIEVDGEVHRRGDLPDRDARGDAWLRAQGLRVMRIGAVDVMKDLNSVVVALISACRR